MMRPIGYKTKKGNTILIYRFRDLRRFIMQGRETGDVGFIIISRDRKGMIKYKGYGTIEHPSRSIQAVYIQHNPLFDGKWDVNRMIHPMVRNSVSSYRYELIDLSKN
jgi:hypothetical protein